ncbi:DoxX family protein [Hymenobacter tibetensis]|uniref:DoxX family protein n=1 Tax=Hymenobacter tibetensis TaxID=497967 RepID=A0ABY4CRR9_9BACT|nr:DoxX family protein [Hymenobacter tibetensis]UOG72963.1 DoxX family protein [Hymenobacter tibetensis]
MALHKKTLLTGLLTAVPALMVVGSGLFKLTGVPEIREALTKAGVIDYMYMLGAMELVFAALFLYPKTMKLGVLLLTAYFAGAMATDLSHGVSPLPPAFILTLVWIAAFVRDRSVFLPTPSVAS